MFVVSIVIFILIVIVALLSSIRDNSGFDRNGSHKNGTKFDDDGNDEGYDKNAYDGYDYNLEGDDINGYNSDDYNIDGKNRKGQYNRFFDVHDYVNDEYSKDGFLNPGCYPVIVTDHAKMRIRERMGADVNPYKIAREAYAYGKSAKQLMKTSAAMLKDIESRHGENSVALIYRGYIFVFSEDNKLITMFKNDRVIV